jgi:hypothetical protein
LYLPRGDDGFMGSTVAWTEFAAPNRMILRVAAVGNS